MILFALAGVLVLTVAGCVCVVWDARGGPRWVHTAAAVTLAVGRLARSNRRRGLRSGGGDGGDGDGSDG